jgi:hypothetical protein
VKREYSGVTKDDVIFFTGVEVERTPAYGQMTLFVTGVQDTSKIEELYNKHNCSHIFFGANHSLQRYYPSPKIEIWERMITPFLARGILCSLDIPLDIVESVNAFKFSKHPNFIPQIRIPLPHIEKMNDSTMIKLDDKGYDQTNPGVWTIKLKDLRENNKLTEWSEYTNDKEISNE